ncbi:hypothetical protein STIAU_3548, partial [Stigmatella aurantiaca DW4/3-1]
PVADPVFLQGGEPAVDTGGQLEAGPVERPWQIEARAHQHLSIGVIADGEHPHGGRLLLVGLLQLRAPGLATRSKSGIIRGHGGLSVVVRRKGADQLA